MGSDAKKAFNAHHRDELLWFDPATLTIVGDKASELNDPDSSARAPEWMVKSIMALGVQVPIIVRKNGEDARGVPIVEVVDGRQRVRATLEANRRLGQLSGDEQRFVPGIRTRGAAEDMMAVMILTNALRKQETPVSKARKAQRYIGYGKSVGEAADLFGVKPQAVSEWLGLLDLDGELQKAVDTGELPQTTALTLVKLPREEQKSALTKMRAEGTLRGKSGVEAAERLTGTARGKTGEEGEVSQLPSRVWLKRLMSELEGETYEGSSDTLAVVAVLKLALEGKKPRGNVVAEAWRAVQKRFSRGRAEADAAE